MFAFFAKVNKYMRRAEEIKLYIKVSPRTAIASLHFLVSSLVSKEKSVLQTSSVRKKREIMSLASIVGVIRTKAKFWRL